MEIKASHLVAAVTKGLKRATSRDLLKISASALSAWPFSLQLSMTAYLKYTLAF